MGAVDLYARVRDLVGESVAACCQGEEIAYGVTFAPDQRSGGAGIAAVVFLSCRAAELDRVVDIVVPVTAPLLLTRESLDPLVAQMVEALLAGRIPDQVAAQARPSGLYLPNGRG